MKILLVHNYYKQRGGEDAVVEQELSLLRERGHDVELHAVHNDAIQGWRGKLSAGLLAIYNPFAKQIFTERLQRFRPDVVHVHNFFPQLSPAIFDACRAARVPSVMTLHNFRILCPTATLSLNGKIEERSLTHSALWTVRCRAYQESALATLPVAMMVDIHKAVRTWRRKVDLFIALTDFAKAKFVEGGLPAERIVVKPNAITDPGRPDDSTPRRGALYVGRLSPEKGIATLLEAWRTLDVPLTIAGGGPMSEQCSQAANGRIKYLGAVDPQRVRDEMCRAAFLILPSTCYDMFPLTLLEAYANGLPVLASKLGALQSLVDHGQTGLSFVSGSPEALREAVTRAIANPADMVRMGRNARSVYEAHYTAEQNHANLMTAYRRAMMNTS